MLYTECVFPHPTPPHIHMLNEYDATPSAMVSGDGAFERELGLDELVNRGPS